MTDPKLWKIRVKKDAPFTEWTQYQMERIDFTQEWREIPESQIDTGTWGRKFLEFAPVEPVKKGKT